jgi:signal transduction histidine kinase
MARRTLLITYIATYLLAVGSIIRYLVGFRDDRLWSIALLLGGYLLLLFAEPFLIRRNRLLTYVYLFVQTAIVCTLSSITPTVDFWAVLFCPLVVQVMHTFPQRTGFFITGIFTVIASVFLLWGLGLEVGLPLVLVYAVIYFLLAAFIAIILEAVAARRESQMRQAELQQEVEQRLQVEEALRLSEMEKAVTEERSRLARELHDSVTQSLYSLTLFTEATRQMAEDAGQGGIERQIGQIGRIGLQALKEMRLLVYELRPPELKEEGLVRALRKRLEAVEGRAGVEARMVVDADDFGRLPRSVELELYRIAQEALNNALKHAAATKVVVHLRKGDGRVELEVVDDGLGFQPEAVRDHGGMGLESIRQRAEGLGGTATIRSARSEGTRVKVIADLEEDPYG